MKKYFPKYSSEGNSAILIIVKDGVNASVICNYTRNFTYYMKDGLSTNYEDPDFMQEFESYWTLYDDDMAEAAMSMITVDEKAMLIDISGREVTSVNSTKFIKRLLDLLNNFTRDNKDERFEIERTGDDIIMHDFYGLSLQEIIVTDSISASIALIVMLLLIRSLVLMIVPFINLLCSLLCTVGALYLVAINANVGTFVPAIIIAVIIAMTIDYSLFMLVRFRKELDRVSPHGEPVPRDVYFEVVHTTVCFAGHVISISGSTLAIAFAGICLLGIELLVTLGLGAAMGLFCTILVNLSMGPALLLTFPRFFTIPGVIPCAPNLVTRDTCCPCCKKGKERDDEPKFESVLPVNSTDAQETTTLIAGSPAPEKQGADEEEEDVDPDAKYRKEILSSRWYHLSEILTSKEGSCIIMVLVLATLAPIMYGVRWFGYTVDNRLVFTDDLPAMKTLNDMESRFPPGMLYPIYLCAVPKEYTINGTFTRDYFEIVPEVVKRIKNATNNGLDDSGVMSTAYAYGTPIDFDTASMLLDPNSILYNTSYGKMYKMLVDRVLSEDHNASLIMMMVNFNPNAGPMTEWIHSVRDDVIEDLNKDTKWSWTLSAVFVDEVDVCDKSFSLFPMMISITIVVIVVFVSLAFRSLVLPLRLVFSLGLTVVWTYGAASLVFCLGAVDWIPAVKDIDSLYWLVTLVVLTIIIGLGIDYDVFLFSRITEERERGYTPDEAIRLGYYHTGGVITGAGVVMAIAFSGLMLSKQHVLQQLGFFLSTSVLLDTFVVRMLLVPTLLHFLGRANWWPSKMPPSTLPDLREAQNTVTRRGYNTISE